MILSVWSVQFIYRANLIGSPSPARILDPRRLEKSDLTGTWSTIYFKQKPLESIYYGQARNYQQNFRLRKHKRRIACLTYAEEAIRQTSGSPKSSTTALSHASAVRKLQKGLHTVIDWKTCIDKPSIQDVVQDTVHVRGVHYKKDSRQEQEPRPRRQRY